MTVDSKPRPHSVERRSRSAASCAPTVGGQLAAMAKKRTPQPAPWQRDEVHEDGRRAGEAERAADRAEGKTPLSVADAADRAGDEDEVDLPRRRHDGPTPEEVIAEVAEEHRERMAAGERGRGKL